MKVPRFAAVSIFNASNPRQTSRSTRHVTRHSPSSSFCTWAPLLVVVAGGTANAQTLAKSADMYINMIGDPNYHAVQLNTREGDVLKVNYDTDFNAGYGNSSWESVTWVSKDGPRVSAAMAGMNEYNEPYQDRNLTINNLTVQDVDLDMANVQLQLHAPTASPNAPIAITLNNGSLGGGLRTPKLWSPSPFQFNVIGDSRIEGWEGALGSVTTLNVASGATLRIKNSGSVTASDLSHKLYFSQLNNTAAITGGSLIIDNSAVVFGRDPHSLDTNQSAMTFSNNATLRIQGPNTTPKLETDRIVIQNSTLSMANNTDLKLRNTLELDNSAAVLGDNGKVNALQVIAKGNSTATLEHSTGGGQGITTDFLKVESGATFTLAGAGDLGVNGAVNFPSSGLGAIRVTGDSALVLNQANLILNSHGSLTTEHTATTDSQIVISGSVMTLYQSGSFTNNGIFSSGGNSDIAVIGNGTIGGTGLMWVDSDLGFATGGLGDPGKNSLTTDNAIAFDMNSVLTMVIDPAARVNDFITVNGTLSINLLAKLQLTVVNDQALPFDLKFKLIDYSEGQLPLNHSNRFDNLPDGAVFTQGLNSFRIDYSDENYAPGNSNVITLTTVIPEPSVALLTLLGAAALTTRRRTPQAGH